MTPDTLGALVTRAAERHGDRLAVEMEGRTLTWAGLEAAANRVARSLAAHGVRRGDRVALWLPKSPEAIASLYGVMKAGAAFVPVDPGAPPARMAWIVRNAGAAALVTAGARLADVAAHLGPDDAPAGVWLADDAVLEGAPGRLVRWSALAAESDAPPEAAPASGDLAYVLYTSGSTGEPKGVMHSHASALAFVRWAATEFAVTADDRLANHAPFHFDLSTFDLYAAAWAGASVHPVPARLFSFPAAIARDWSARRLSVWYVTPSQLVLMLTRGGLTQHDLSALRVLLFAGEVMPVRQLREVMRLAPHARFANLYGPTETNVCTWHPVHEPPATDAPLPIGTACAGDETHVLGEDGRPVARGEAGELWVRGDTVMLGYWGDPERTERTLRPLPGENANGPAYRTGDMVRERDDGALEFLGRRDHQIKTRGYRVELGEIEAVLAAHPSVAECVVIAIPDEEITHRLAAAVVAIPDAATDAEALKRHLAATLPRYMVPETITFHTRFPRTSSGKVDRRALAIHGT